MIWYFVLNFELMIACHNGREITRGTRVIGQFGTDSSSILPEETDFSVLSWLNLLVDEVKRFSNLWRFYEYGKIYTIRL